MILAFMPPRILRAVVVLGVTLLAPSVGVGQDLAPAELSVTGMTYVASEGARSEVIVEAERARVGQGERVAVLDTVHARLGSYAAPDSPQGGLELNCDRGTFDFDGGDLTAEGNVRGRTADGRRFETEHLVYRRETGRVTTQSPVVIRDGFGTLRGQGFEYWVRENRFRLVGGASVVQER